MSEHEKPAENAASAPNPAPQPSSKLIPTDKRVLVMMFFVLLAGVSLILWAWKIGPFHSAVESTENS